MSEDLPNDAICKNCDYPLCNLPAQRCPECGRPFEINNENTYGLKSEPKRGRFFDQVFLYTAIHFFGVPVLSAFGGAINIICDTVIPSAPPIGNPVIFIAKLFLQPKAFLQNSPIGQSVPYPNEFLYYLINSFFWGFGLAYTMSYIKRCKNRKWLNNVA